MPIYNMVKYTNIILKCRFDKGTLINKLILMHTFFFIVITNKIYIYYKSDKVF